VLRGLDLEDLFALPVARFLGDQAARLAQFFRVCTISRS
jgi:hypothetical protein